MRIYIDKDAKILGENAATLIASLLNKAISEKGEGRLLLSTGASQFSTIEALLEKDIDWSKVEMFHLDEYVGLDEFHPASFRRYLTDRFTSKVNLKKAHFVDGNGDIENNIAMLTKEVRRSPIDVGVIGIGENSHIAFNDPPADFVTKEAFKVVNLDDKCKSQQVREGWFEKNDDVPKNAVTMTVSQILLCKTIISSVPYEVKANAIKDTLSEPINNMVPATILKTHPDWHLFLDEDSARDIYNLKQTRLETGRKYYLNEDLEIEDLGMGVKRKVLAYNKNLMAVEVYFEEGAVGEVHSHPHEQITYIIEGEFEFNIDGEKKILKKGDSTFKKSNIPHGAVCIKKGKLLDIFTPYRKEFIK